MKYKAILIQPEGPAECLIESESHHTEEEIRITAARALLEDYDIKVEKVYLETFGDHPEKKDNEVLIGYFSSIFFDSSVTWETKRMGTQAKEKGVDAGKMPVFIEKKEAISAGWHVK